MAQVGGTLGAITNEYYTNNMDANTPTGTDELPCTDKISFDTQTQAQAAATVALYQHGARLKTYRCRHCDLWHLSSAQNRC